MLVILVTNKVFSPQYVLWLLAAVTAAAVLDPELWARYVKPVLALALMTQLVFPLFYGDILFGSWIGVVILTLRDVLLVYLSGEGVLGPRPASWVPPGSESGLSSSRGPRPGNSRPIRPTGRRLGTEA